MQADVLDLFAGTGSLGIEALSRGAKSAVFNDRSSECLTVIKENLLHTKLADKAVVFSEDAIALLNRFAREERKFHIIFLDPPYRKDLLTVIINIIAQNEILNDDGIIVAERDFADNIPEVIGDIRLARNQQYGDTVLSFYKKEGKAN
jgi:16S rRNA (guanine966-N2)-methyltransferase